MYNFVGKPTEDKHMKKLFKNEEGVSPVIAVILMVAITVVLAAVLYVMVSGMMQSTETTPRGSLSFSDDPNVSLKYIGQFQGSVKLDKVDISILDASTGQTAVEQAPTGDFTITTAGGLNLSYDDVQPDGKMDASDILIITGGGAGDKVTIVWKSTGETVGSDTI
jgi:flagellin-like protein